MKLSFHLAPLASSLDGASPLVRAVCTLSHIQLASSTTVLVGVHAVSFTPLCKKAVLVSAILTRNHTWSRQTSSSAIADVSSGTLNRAQSVSQSTNIAETDRAAGWLSYGQ